MGQFARLVSENQVSKVTLAIEKAVTDSFRKHPVRHLTAAEIKRRFDICADIFEALRGDMKWGIDRACDRLLEYLNAKLDGTDWKPDARTIWAPGDGA